MKDYEWLSKLKPGDKVIVYGGGAMYYDRVCEVERLTNTQVVLKGTRTRYRIKDGHEIGSVGWYKTYIKQGTAYELQKIVNAQTHRRLYNELERIKWRDKSLKVLREVMNVLENNSEI